MSTSRPQSRPLILCVGGGGGSTAEHLLSSTKFQHLLNAVDVACANTDVQALNRSSAQILIQLGSNGLGAGGKPDIAHNAAASSTSRLQEVLVHRSLLIVLACLGGGTGTGAAPYITTLAQSLGITTLFVGTLPFDFEGPRRIAQAKSVIGQLSNTCDATLILPNEMLLDSMGDHVTQDQAYAGVNDIIAFALSRAITPHYRHSLLKDALGSWNSQANWTNLLSVLGDWEHQTASVFGRGHNNERSSIITLRNERQLIEIAKDPHQIKRVTPRQFEELMYALYRAAGLRTELTKQARDDGVDLLVWTPGSLFGSEFLTVVQLKRYTGKQRVGSPAIRELKGTQALFDAHRAECISTTSFTRTARSTATALAIDLAEFSQLCDKIREVVGR